MRPKRCPHLIETRMDDEVLVYDPAGDRTHRLNACASIIWERCDGGHTVEDIAHTLTEKFEVAFERALCDTQTVVQQLGDEQLVSEAPAA